MTGDVTPSPRRRGTWLSVRPPRAGAGTAAWPGFVRAALAIMLALPAACAGRAPSVEAPDPVPAADASAAGTAPTASGAAPGEIGDGWRTAAPDAVGLDAGRLAAMTDAVRRGEHPGIHAILIEKDGRLVYEQYFAGEDARGPGGAAVYTVFGRDTTHDLRSMTKSVVSALVGIALGSGAIRSLDQPLLDYFPEHADLATPEKRGITLRHALTMTAGLAWREGDLPYRDPGNDEGAMDRSRDPVRYVLSRPVEAPPGTRWRYNGGLTQVLAAVVERATGQGLRDYARERLFAPLGVREWFWRGSPANVPHAASGLELRPRDLAKFGSLYLHEGRWNGQRILSADWVRASTIRRVGAGKDSVWALGETGYGYQWWHDRLRTDAGWIESHTALGNGQQRIFVLPELRLVVTMLAGRYNDRTATGLTERLLLTYVVPAARPEAGDALVASTRAEHLDTLTREPMLAEHPGGALFVAGYNRVRPGLWRSLDRGVTWHRMDVGTAAEGAVGNSDVDLAVAPDGTLYLAQMTFDNALFEGRGIAVGVSRDTGATWRWSPVSRTRFDDRPWIAVAPDGTAHLVWNDDRGVHHARSDDRGVSWRRTGRVHDRGGSSHLTVGPGGELAVRVAPGAASGNQCHPDTDLVAVSTDRGATWRTRPAPGTPRAAGCPGADEGEIPRWVDPLAWDADGALHALWTDSAGVWLARSADRGETWRSWPVVARRPGEPVAHYPFLAARGRGELAATWFVDTGDPLSWRAARLTPRGDAWDTELSAAMPLESWRAEPRRADEGGEYLAVRFLRDGSFAVVTPIQHHAAGRLGFTWWRFGNP